MPQISIEEALKRPVQKPKKQKPLSIEEALAAPVIPAPPAVPSAPAPGFLGNLEIGARRALAGATDAGIVLNEAVSAAMAGDFTPLKELAEQAGRGAAPFVSALSGRPELAATRFIAESAAQSPRIGELTRQRNERIGQNPDLYSTQVVNQEEKRRLDALAALDPSLTGKVVRRGTEGVLTAIPSVVAGTATGGSVPAMATVVGLQSLAAPETLIPSIALAATPIPLGKAIAPIVRRIKPNRAASVVEAPIAAEARTAGAIPETPAASVETALPAVETPSPLPSVAPVAERPLTALQQEADALNSAIQKLGTDSVDEIGEMIANANRRFNKTVTAPGSKKRPITPAERQSMKEDFARVSMLTKEENEALAGVLSERSTSPVFSEPIPAQKIKQGEARNISDIPLDEPNAQLDANLRQLKAFFGSQDIVRESKIAAAVGQNASDPAKVRVADLGLPHVETPTPMHAPDAVPVGRRLSVDDIQLGRDELSKGRMFQAQESLKGGVKDEGERVQPIVVTPDPANPGKFIVTDDGNHRVALLKLQGVTDDIPVKSYETPAQTASIRSAVGPRAGEIAPMEMEIGDQLRQAIGAMRARRGPQPKPEAPIARNMDPLEVESMAGARQAPLFDPQRNMAPLNVGSMKAAEQLPLLDVAQKSRLRKALNLAADALQLPRALMSSADISFPFRQGLIFNLPPSRWGKAGKSMVEMFRALVPDRPTSIKGGIKAQFKPQTERYARMVEAIASDPDAALAQNHGLKLTSQTQGGLRKAEEEFVSRMADRIPIVRESQQAYTMAADYTRLNTFKLYKQAIDERAAKEGFTADQIKRGYEAAARWINIGSGRGNFGEKADRAMDVLNFFIFSPRFIASRLQVLNPLTYLRNAGTAEGRVVLKKQMSELAQLTAMVGGTMALAKAAGFKVGTNPDKPDFLRVSLGNYHYDGLAGLQPVMRLVYGLSADAARAAKGEKPVEGKTALDVGARFLRSKAAPIPSFFVDFFDRKTFEGKPFNLTDAAVERLSPMMWGDMVEAYQREGLGGALKLAPGAVGFGAQYYEPKPIDAAIEQRPGLLNELIRLQVRIADPRRKPDETDDAYKGRQEAVANLYSRYAASLMSSRDYAGLTEEFKKEAFDALHSRILAAVNSRDRRINQFQPEAIINAVRRADVQGKIRAKRIARRRPL